MSEQSKADAAKALGAEAYKKRDFETAAKHFKTAWELHKDVVYLNNLAAAYFEQGSYDLAIETCQNAVDEGREVRADFKTIAKSFARIGSAYVKKQDYENAVKFFQKSLSEHRTPETLTKLKEAEKAQADAARLAYIDPALSDKARNEGNDFWKKGDYPSAQASYTEAIKRNPDDIRGYTNRAQTLIKLLAPEQAIKDADEAIKIDAKNAKGYIRKAQAYTLMKEYDKALKFLDEATSADQPGNKNSTEISRETQKVTSAKYKTDAELSPEERLKKAERDPEIQAILGDPVMRSILGQAQEDPKSLQEHMKNPEIMQKIIKLMNAGILQTR